MCRKPVGEGAKRVTTSDIFMGSKGGIAIERVALAEASAPAKARSARPAYAFPRGDRGASLAPRTFRKPRGGPMDFVFMLTRNDATVENALELIEIARPLKLKHIGFKDVGANSCMLRRLTAAIREAGASPWMEIVATTRESELRGVELGRDLGVDMLMGGVHVEEALKLLGGSATRYLPFAGAPSGHPTRLGGSAAGSRGAMPKLRETRLRGRRHSCLSRDRGRAARPRRRLPARISQFRHGRGRGKHQFARSASPPFAPPARTPSPSAPRRSTVPTRPAPDRLRRSSRRCSPIATRRGEGTARKA